MRRLSGSATARHLSVSSVLFLFVLASLGAAMAHHSAGGLHREDSQSWIDADPSQGSAGVRPNDVLAANEAVFVRGDGALEVQFRYQCRAGSGTQLDPDCDLGAAAGGASTDRTAQLFYTNQSAITFTGTGASPSATLQAPLVAGNIGQNSLVFSGAIPASFIEAQAAGSTIRFATLVQVDRDGPGSGAAEAQPDPEHTSEGEFLHYTVRLDQHAPRIDIGQPSIGAAFHVEDGPDLIVSSDAYPAGGGSFKAPRIAFGIFDNTSGAGLDRDTLRLHLHETARTLPSPQEGATDHAVAYIYQLPQIGDNGMQVNEAVRLDFIIEDRAGYRINTTGATEPFAWFAVDHTPPQFGKAVLQQKEGAKSSLVGRGDQVELYVKATDVLGKLKGDPNTDVPTPPEALTIDAVLFATEDTDERSDPHRLVWNATCQYPGENSATGCFRSQNLTLPEDWSVSGPVKANLTITDPGLRVIRRDASGQVSVDIENPVVTPLAPLGADVLDGFTRNTQVEFRLRAHDPGDSDAWEGTSHSNDDDTDEVGIDVDEVRLHYRVGGGNLNTLKLTPRSAENTFAITRTFNAEDNVTYHFTVKDLAGNTVRYPTGEQTVHLRIDRVAPTLRALSGLDFIGRSQAFVVEASDRGSGVDPDGAKLFWRLEGEGSFRERAMSARDATNAANMTFEGTIPAQDDGATVQFFIQVSDILGNRAEIGSVSSPRSALVDTVAPNATITSPSTTSDSNFTIRWDATDRGGGGQGSGIMHYTVQFKVGNTGNWNDLLKETEQKEFAVCARTQTTYHFRVSATDNAGNTAPMPDQPMSSTFVDAAESCAQPATVTLEAPAEGATLSGDVEVRWTAVSTTSPEGLTYRIEVRNGDRWATIAEGLTETSHTWNTANPGANEPCFEDGTYGLRVTATDPAGLEGRGERQSITLSNGIDDCDDRDGDDMPDAWEFANFGHLDHDANADPDGDGFTNRQEFEAGTNPSNGDDRPADGGGGGGGGDDDGSGFSPWYLVVILLFGTLIGVFVVGTQRRW